MKRAAVLALLLQIKGVGRATVRKLLAVCSRDHISLEQDWKSVATAARLAGWSQQQLAGITRLPQPEEFLARAQSLDTVLIDQEDARYPELLAQSPDAPLILFCKGDLRLLEAKTKIAVVGTRRPTSYGSRVARELSKDIAKSGGVVVSGFMYGVDILAQQSALQAGGGTIGVLGFGFSHMYPSSHQRLFSQFLEQNALFISEYAPDVAPQKVFFAERNRVVAGLTQATVVVEAAAQSGTLITAQSALDAGREVCAVPGSIYSPYSNGTRYLLNQGAQLVASAGDIFATFEGDFSLLPQVSSSASPRLSELQKKIVQLLTTRAASLTEISAQLQVDVLELSQPLLELELSNRVGRCGTLLELKTQTL